MSSTAVSAVAVLYAFAGRLVRLVCWVFRLGVALPFASFCCRSGLPYRCSGWGWCQTARAQSRCVTAVIFQR
jgi:hypothetical protein